MVSVEDYKSFIRVTGSSQDAFYQQLIDAASSIIRAACNQYLSRQTDVVEYYSPRFQPFIILRQRPVIEVTQVQWDEVTQDATSYKLEIDQADGTSRSGILHLLEGQGEGTYRRPAGRLTPLIEPARGSVRVTYSCGFHPIPNDLKTAVLLATRTLQLSAPYGGSQVKSESRPHYSYSLGDLASKEITLNRLLSRYVALGIQ